MNKKIVSNWAKKNFLHWFMETYLHQGEAAKEVLSFLCEQEERLSGTHFVLDGSNVSPLLVVSTSGTGMPPLLLKTMDSRTTDDEMILSSMQRLEDSPLFLTLYFPGRIHCEPLQAVLEEDSPTRSSENSGVLLEFELSLWSETFKRELERTVLMHEIDRALDERDRENFIVLVKKLKKL